MQCNWEQHVTWLSILWYWLFQCLLHHSHWFTNWRERWISWYGNRNNTFPDPGLGDAASLEDAVGTSNIHSAELYEKPWMNSDEICFQLLQDGRRTIYMRQRPFLPIFLRRVAEMFEIIVFTANQSIYAEQLLDKMEGVGYTNIAVYRSVEEDITWKVLD